MCTYYTSCQDTIHCGPTACGTSTKSADGYCSPCTEAMKANANK